MPSQMAFALDTKEETRKRDQALNLIECHRQNILGAAKKAALDLFLKNGRVTAPEVFALLKEKGFETALSEVDPRFMGAVFREGTGWKRIGWENKGSHRRPVSVWIRASSQGVA